MCMTEQGYSRGKWKESRKKDRVTYVGWSNGKWTKSQENGVVGSVIMA